MTHARANGRDDRGDAAPDVAERLAATNELLTLIFVALLLLALLQWASRATAF